MELSEVHGAPRLQLGSRHVCQVSCLLSARAWKADWRGPRHLLSAAALGPEAHPSASSIRAPAVWRECPSPMAPSSALSIFFFEDEEPRTPHLLRPTKRRVGAWQWSTQMLLDVTAALCSCCQLPRPQGPCHVGLCPWLLVAAAAVAGRGSQTPTDHSVSY